MELHGRDGDGGGKPGVSGRDEGQAVGVRDEDRVGVAGEAGEDVGAEVVDGADEVFVAHEDVG